MEVLKINGHDYSNLLTESGISWKLNALDSEESGRSTMDGKMHRAVIAYKLSAEVKMKPLTQSQLQMVTGDLKSPFFQVEYMSPIYGRTVGTFYSNNVQMTLNRVYKYSIPLWDGVSFPLIER